jgi:ABC-2 type transport system ATP-binding protein
MLSIQEITKNYSTHTALSQVSMEIEKGSIFGLLGPNGAGKTSLIRIINQITAPDKGKIFFNNEPLQPRHIEKIGYLPEERGLYKKMEVGEQVLYLAQLKGLSRSESLSRAKKWFIKLEIQDWWNKKVEDLSKGMQQKVQFIATVIHEPEFLILDEPFTGFDPINAELIRKEILELNQKGTTIIFSTHRLENIEEFCTHIALINKSRKILDGKTRDILNQFRNNTYKIEFSGDPESFKSSIPADFTLLNEGKGMEYNHAEFIINQGSLNHLVGFLLPHISIQGLKESVPSISDIFIKKVTEENHKIPA